MSNPNPITNYKIADGRDLSVIFMPISSGTRITGNTNYKIPDISSGDKDLADVFASLDGRTPVSFDTGYKYNNTDLRLIFADINTPTNNSLPFTLSGSNISYTRISNYYVITCTAGTSTITFNTEIPNVSIICVGGGGGGGGGYYNNNNFGVITSYFGNGGGGGGNMLFNPVSLIGTYNITIGTGGTAGIGARNIVEAGSGGATSFSTADNTTLYACSGGAGGFCGVANTSVVATGGSVTAGGSLGAGAGGAGGDYPENSSGSSSSSQMTNFRIPSALTSTISASYCGGGGGAGTSKGGACGTNTGGGAAGVTNNTNGQSATDYGSGGGGASNLSNTNINSNSSGGAGANGVLIMFFSYP
jgi:hypothetical protein